MKKTVVIVDGQNNRYVDNDLSLERSLLNDDIDVVLKEVKSYKELLNDDIVQNATILISWYAISIPKEVIAQLKNCLAIIRPAVGYENIDTKYAREKGIPVLNVPDYGTEEVADHTLALILASNRNIFTTNFHAKKDKWDWKTIGVETSRLRGLTAGIVGLGRIGKAVALRLKAFGIRVCFYDPYEKSGIDKSMGITEIETLDQLIEQSDILTFHVPLNDETKDLLNKKNSTLLKSNALIVNTCRGEVLNQESLIRLLKTTNIRLGLDVLATEPIVPEIFKTSRQVLLTAHSAFYSQQSLYELKQSAIKSAHKVLTKQPLKNIIN